MSAVRLDDEWSLWPDFAVRSSGFPVEGLDAFGPGESERLAAVACDPAFREAVAWQSRESLARAVDKLATGAAGSPSRRRRWEDVVASYWQRYCSKNDTIGFFGPLAWGSFAEEGDAIAVRSGALERERVVHFETWAVEALARAAGIDAPLPMCPFPERALRPLLADTTPLDRLEAARERVAAARREDVAAALGELDAVFEALTGRPAARAERDSGGGRTIAYLDCMRDLDVSLGPAIVAELRASLPRVLAASRWWCGQVFERGAAVMQELAQPGPLAPQLGRLMGAGFALWDQMGEEQAELRRRWAAGDGFGDWRPSWPYSVFHSADIQIATHGEDFLLVLGDFHGGANPLAQGQFSLRHPDPDAMLRRIADDAGPGVHLSPPRHGAVDMTARNWPTFAPGDVVVASNGEPAQAGTRPVALEDLVVDGGEVGDRAGTLRVPVAHLLFLPIFIAGVRSFDPVGDGNGRAQVGRLVIRRATWTAAAGELPEDLAAWARDRGLPRRVFARSPTERKPRYVDFESPSLCRALARFVAPARERAPDAGVEFTEMLPAPEECWLESDAGHHTSEMRIVAVDRSAQARGSSSAIIAAARAAPPVGTGR